MKQAIRQRRERPGRAARRGLGLFLALLLLFTASPLSCISRTAAYADEPDPVTIQVEGSFVIDSTRQMLNNINDLRANDAWYWNETDTEQVQVPGLAPLAYDYTLERIAMQRAAELAVYYAHVRPNGERCFSAYTSEFTWSAMGENIAYGFTSAGSVFTAWAEANEPYEGQGHRRNMLSSSFTAVGIGCFECEGVLFWAQEFSSKKTGASANPLTSPVSMEVLRANIDSASIGGQIQVLLDSPVALSGIVFRVTGAYRPWLSVPCSSAQATYSIADTGVARIRNGKIEGLREGKTTLTVTVGGLSASALLVVTEDTTIPLQLDTPMSINIAAGETVLFSFTPSETGSYSFYSSGDSDTYGNLYDSDMNELDYNDDGGEGYNFRITCELTAGTSYFFSARLYSGSASGSTTVTLEKDSATISGDFAYELLSDGTVSITECALTGDIVIPDTLDGYTVSNLAAYLFFGQSGITSVTIPASVTFFGDDSSDNYWDYVFSYCYDLQNIFVAGDNPTFRSVDGVLFSKDGNTLINYPCDHEGTVYHVTADTLCCTAFASCRNLRFLFLDNAFSVWYTYTFYNTGSLTSFYISGGTSEWEVENDSQSSCSFVCVDEIVRLPDDLKRIEADAFRNTAIPYVSVPSGCTRIKAGAFTGSGLVFAQVGPSTVIENGAFDSGVVVERRSA